MGRAMSSTWTVSVAGRSYGPYSLDQMQAFAAEGRLAPHSLVQRAGEPDVRQATEDSELATLFAPVARAAAPAPGRSETPATFGRQDDAAVSQRTHFVIISDMKSGSVASLEEEIFNLGQAFALLPQVWILLAESSVNAVRNRLIQKLGKLDILFVADATHDKAAWFNFGPEAEARIRRIWQKSSDGAARRAG